MATLHCLICDKPFRANRPQAKYCGDTCRKRAQRGVPALRQVKAPISAVYTEGGDLVSAVTAELEVAGRRSSALGIQAILPARYVQEDNGTASVALSRELRAVMAAALQNAPTGEVDPLDELKARRDAKRAAGMGGYDPLAYPRAPTRRVL